jgi:hypothetical protein
VSKSSQDNDFSLWKITVDGEYRAYADYKYTRWVIHQETSGMWYWDEYYTNAWDGEKLYTEIQQSSGRGFDTWQEAAIDCEKQCDVD